jgi:hypothetical protein
MAIKPEELKQMIDKFDEFQNMSDLIARALNSSGVKPSPMAALAMLGAGIAHLKLYGLREEILMEGVKLLYNAAEEVYDTEPEPAKTWTH